MKKIGIIFDVDGTLWNVNNSVLKGWNIFLKMQPDAKELFTIESMTATMGLTPVQIADKWFDYIEAPRRYKWIDGCIEQEIEVIRKDGPELFADEENVLESLSKKYNLYILSNAFSGYAELMYETTGFGRFFEDQVCYGDNHKSKTENIKLIMEKHRLDCACYIGDTRGDMKYTVDAGIPFIHARYGFDKDVECKYYINCFNELEDVIKKIEEEVWNQE